MPEQRLSGIERATAVVGLVAALTAAATWFVGDVPRVVRLGVAAIACAVIVFVRVQRRTGYRLLYASVPILVFLALVLVPASQSWLLERSGKASAAQRGPRLAIEDVQPSWDSGREASDAKRFRLSIVIRNRGSEPAVVNRALLGYHQGGGVVGGTADEYWLQDEVLAMNESAAGQILEIRQAANANAEFAVPVIAFGRWFVGTVWDQVIELRPQAEIPANSVRTVRVTMPLKLRLDTVAGSVGLKRFKGRTMDFFVRWNEPYFDSFPRLLTVTVNTTDGRCAQRTTVLEAGSDRSAKPRRTAFLDHPVKFKDLCGWSPPSPPR